MRNEEVVMTLPENLQPLYEHLITTLEMMPMKKLTMKYMTACLMHEMFKRKENEPQDIDVAFVLCQGKWDIPSSRRHIKRVIIVSNNAMLDNFAISPRKL